jgi:hypothetical protein
MTTFKQELTPLAKKYKFYYFIDDMEDDEIIDFLADEVFGTKDFKNFTFEQAKEKCKSIGGSLDSMIEEADQKVLFLMLQKHA